MRTKTEGKEVPVGKESKTEGRSKTSSRGTTASKSQTRSTGAKSRSAAASSSRSATASKSRGATASKSRSTTGPKRSSAQGSSRSSSALSRRTSTAKSGGARGSVHSRTTTDHEEIRRWAEDRGAHPACVKGTGNKGDIGMLRLDFPGYSGKTSLQQISWDEFFEKFDERGLALLFQERTSGGSRSNFNKIVSREAAGEKPKVRAAR